VKVEEENENSKKRLFCHRSELFSPTFLSFFSFFLLNHNHNLLKGIPAIIRSLVSFRAPKEE